MLVELGGGQLLADVRSNVIRTDDSWCLVAASLVFNVAFFETTLANDDPMRDADEFEVGKHHAGPLVAIVD